MQLLPGGCDELAAQNVCVDGSVPRESRGKVITLIKSSLSEEKLCDYHRSTVHAEARCQVKPGKKFAGLREKESNETAHLSTGLGFIRRRGRLASGDAR